jgi:hypothetical protein
MPNMLRDILSQIVASEVDMMVAGCAEDDEDLLMTTRRTRANAIVVGQTTRADVAAEDELQEYASLLVGRPDGGRAAQGNQGAATIAFIPWHGRHDGPLLMHQLHYALTV